jgi:hypothetical protein
MLIALALTVGVASAPLFIMRSVADSATLLSRMLPGTVDRPEDSQQACGRRTLYAISISVAGIMLASGSVLFFQGIKRNGRQ